MVFHYVLTQQIMARSDPVPKGHQSRPPQDGVDRPVLDRLEADHANLRSVFLRLLELDRVPDAPTSPARLASRTSA